MAIPVFVYLDAGSRKSAHLRNGEVGIEIELRYSVSTLKADKSAPHKIGVYTDRPERYESLGVDVVDITKIDSPEFKDQAYIYRLKPSVLLHALRRYGGVCVFLDSDTYVHPGFTDAVNTLIEAGPVLWHVGSFPPDSQFPADISGYPHQASHNPNRTSRPLGNSGVIGLKAGRDEPIMEDALWLIDEMRARGDKARTLEQSAIFEAIWLNGRAPYDCTPWLTHYSTNSKKRYMHWQIKRLSAKHGLPLPPTTPCIKLTMPRVKLFQYYWDAKRTLLGLARH